MTNVVTIPSKVKPMSADMGQIRYDTTFEGGSTGDSETVVYSPPRWSMSFSADTSMDRSVNSYWSSMMLSLNGRINRLAIWDFGRPKPRGTQQTNGTVRTAADPGVKSLQLDFGVANAGKTLLVGDYFGVNQSSSKRQVLHVQEDVVVDSGGLVTVQFEPFLRTTVTAASPAVVDRPTWLGQLSTTDNGWSMSTVIEGGMTLSFVESWY